MTPNLTFHDCRISKRGKGAKGTVEVKTLGVPQLNDNGIAKGFTYDHLDIVPTSELLEYAKSRGHINRLIGMAVDMLEKSSSIRAQNAKTELRRILIKLELANNDNADSKAQAVLNAANLTGATHQDVITLMFQKIYPGRNFPNEIFGTAKEESGNESGNDSEDE